MDIMISYIKTANINERAQPAGIGHARLHMPLHQQQTIIHNRVVVSITI
jgi:hypothetical protein